MPWRVTIWSGVLFIVNLGGHLACGQVYLNEIVATSAERTLQRESGQYPWIGNTTSWQSPAYDDSQWHSGPGPFGFGSFSGVTLGTDVAWMVKQRAASLYLRKSFSVTAAQAASGAALFFTLRYNDGFIAFLNGREIARRNMGNPGMFAFHDQTAFNIRSTTASAETINIGAANTQLIEGENVLCVQVHNQAVGGSVGDTLLFLADLQLVGGATLVTQGSDWKYFPGLVEPSGGVLDYGLYEQFLQSNTDSDEPEQGIVGDDLGPLPEPPDAANDWIELHNAGPSGVSLSGWSLTDDAASPRKWMFPSNTVISAGGYLLVLATGNDLTPEQGASHLHANFSLSAQGEYLGLVNADGNVVSELTPGYPPQAPLFSYGRDAEGNWGYFALATPGATNSSPLLTAAPAVPEFSAVGGFHEASFSLTLSTTPSDAEIRYTLDGSEPNPGLLYTGPLSITTD